MAYFNRGTTNDSTDGYGTAGFVAYSGYNYNSDYSYNNTGYTSAILNSTLFSNNNSSDTVTASNIRTQIEAWYASNMTSYTSLLEASAGWCNDRTTSISPSLSDTTIPYSISNYVTFGSQLRNVTNGGGGIASLTCPNTTGYDLLTTTNGYLAYPLAPLTEDEASFAGSGHPSRNSSSWVVDPSVVSNQSSNAASHSYLRSGSAFWLLSPQYRASPTVYVFGIMPLGYSGGYGVYSTYGLRPAISLVHSTTISSGSGISTDPWVITPSN